MPIWFVLGGPVMWPLLFCSLMVATIVLERSVFWLREKRRLSAVAVDGVLDQLRQGKLAGALQAAQAGVDPALRMLVAGIEALPFSPTSSLEGAAKRDLERMNHGLHMLDTMITLTPLLGILGTVLGVIQSFHLLGMEGVQEPRAVVGGISQALITTASGLSIAIAALLPYNLFSALRRKQALRFEEIGRAFEAVCERAGLIEDPPRDLDETQGARKGVRGHATH